jgi:hypothetical protein
VNIVCYYLWSSYPFKNDCDCLTECFLLILFKNRWVCFRYFSNAKKVAFVLISFSKPFCILRKVRHHVSTFLSVLGKSHMYVERIAFLYKCVLIQQNSSWLFILFKKMQQKYKFGCILKIFRIFLFFFSSKRSNISI